MPVRAAILRIVTHWQYYSEACGNAPRKVIFRDLCTYQTNCYMRRAQTSVLSPAYSHSAKHSNNTQAIQTMMHTCGHKSGKLLDFGTSDFYIRVVHPNTQLYCKKEFSVMLATWDCKQTSVWYQDLCCRWRTITCLLLSTTVGMSWECTRSTKALSLNHGTSLKDEIRNVFKLVAHQLHKHWLQTHSFRCCVETLKDLNSVRSNDAFSTLYPDRDSRLWRKVKSHKHTILLKKILMCQKVID